MTLQSREERTRKVGRETERKKKSKKLKEVLRRCFHMDEKHVCEIRSSGTGEVKTHALRSINVKEMAYR
jgi:hypothetical protein